MFNKSSTSTRDNSLLTMYTIGHSNHKADEFIQILHHYQIQLVVDVRSEPYSKYCPQFNKDTIKQMLSNSGIKYLFLGKELGARPEDKDCYVNSKVSFDKLRSLVSFKKGISRLLSI